MSLYNKDGVGDLVLLETIDEQNILQTLKKRYLKDHIYTHIGHVLLSVNPFKEIPGLYTETEINRYRGRYIYENPPHIYGLAEDTYRALCTDRTNQCVIISGESGAGKTEASKKILQYITAITGGGNEIERVKNQILKSNPVLEAFGNAKTIRNNNSSRFGKYMILSFDYKGEPIGGEINTYLLEKVRQTTPSAGERSFHVFYQLLEGAKADQKNRFHLKSPDFYNYLRSSNCYKVDRMNDKEEFNILLECLSELDFKQNEIDDILRIISACLWIGNVEVEKDGSKADLVKVKNDECINVIADLLQADPNLIRSAMTHRTFSANNQSVLTPLNVEQSKYSREALSKYIYQKLFDHIVARVNTAIKVDDHLKKQTRSIGILDIYGFEIFENNQFEQLNINFVNERLQQVFIEKTIKAEQEEYKAEGIAWTEIQYFNNKVVCDLIEKKPIGVFSLLDEECLLGQATDLTFLDKLERNLSSHKHFERVKQMSGASSSSSSAKGQDNLFVITHYAGRVTYNVNGFLDKNKDLVWKDILTICENSRLGLFQSIFPRGLVENMSKSRPPTAATTFKGQVINLMDTLTSCTPHYIRTLKPNDNKKSMNYQEDMMLNQIRYLGLLENVRVRRAGFAYRQTYKLFLKRYKMLSPYTWPNMENGDDGNEKEGCLKILNHLNIQENSQYQCGKTKVFIRQPVTLFTLEELRERKIHELVILIQKTFRAWSTRKFFLEMREKSLEVYQSKKQRRRLSVKRHFVGDYLNCVKDLNIEKLFHKYNDNTVLFADNVNKINRKYKEQVRVIILTDKSIYNLTEIKYKLNRRIELNQLNAVSVSTLSDNFIVLHVNKEYDYIYHLDRKTEFVTMLSDAYFTLKKEKLKVNCTNQIEYLTKQGKKNEILFAASDVTPMNTFTYNVDPKDDKKLHVSVGKCELVNENYIHSLKPVHMAKSTKPKPKPGYAYNADSYSTATTSSSSSSSNNDSTTKVRGISITKSSSPAAPPPARPLPGASSSSVWATALDDFTGADSRELSFKKGEVLEVTKQEPSGWWMAKSTVTFKTGYVPSTYLEVSNTRPLPPRKF